MTGNAFIPRLFIVQLFLTIAGVYCLLQGWFWLAGGCVIPIIVFTVSVNSAYSIDPKTEREGRFQGGLQGYSTIRASLINQARMGIDVSERLDALNESEEEYRKANGY